MLKRIIPIFPILSGILWGAAGIFVRKSIDLGMNNITIVSSKMIIAVIVMFISILMYKKELIEIKVKDIFMFISAGIVGMFGINIFFNESVKYLSLSLAAVLLSLSPVFVVLLSYFFYKEKITLIKIISIILAFIGCVFVSNVLYSDVRLSLWGVASGLLCALSYALYTIISRKAINKGYNSLTITLYAFIFISIVTIPFADWNTVAYLIKEYKVSVSIFIIMHSILVLILPYLFYTISLNHMDAGKASILASCEPAASTIFGVIFFNEIPTILSVFGIILTIVALILLSMPNKKNN